MRLKVYLFSKYAKARTHSPCLFCQYLQTEVKGFKDFKLGRAHLKKLRRAEGGANIFGIFRVKKTILRQKIIYFSNFRGVARRVRAP
jgi:hypothetical protein